MILGCCCERGQVKEQVNRPQHWTASECRFLCLLAHARMILLLKPSSSQKASDVCRILDSRVGIQTARKSSICSADSSPGLRPYPVATSACTHQLHYSSHCPSSTNTLYTAIASTYLFYSSLLKMVQTQYLRELHSCSPPSAGTALSV